MLDARYMSVLFPPLGVADRLPPYLRNTVSALIARRAVAAVQHEIETIDAEIVAWTYWYAVRPDEIARAIIGRRWRVSVAEATQILAACGEAGYPITGNGAPDYERPNEPAPVHGPERDRIIWAAAAYWANAAMEPTIYVSLGDCRGWLPRPVQYDQPGGLHPMQQAALTFGPKPNEYMRRHTRRLLVVRHQ